MADIQRESVSEFQVGQLAVTATPQALPAFRVVKGVTLKNIGAATVLVGTYPLEAGQEVFIPIDDASKIVLSCATSSTISWIAT